MADVQDQQQQIINAQQAVQLAVLPPFSNKPTEDRFTATQWLQKVILHKAGATWTDRQAITHFRNALRGNVIDWFDTLADFGVDTNVWDHVQRSFEIDYHAKPTTTSIVSQLPEINQKSEESTNEYFARAMKILAELKRQVEPDEIVITPLALAADQEALWAAIPEATRNLITSHTRTQAAQAACDVFIATILTSGLKPHIRSKILEKGLTNPLEIKKAAANIEMLDNEKKPKALAPIKTRMKWMLSNLDKIVSDKIKIQVVAMDIETMVIIKCKTNRTDRLNIMETNNSSNKMVERRRNQHAHTARSMVTQLRNALSNILISERKKSMR